MANKIDLKTTIIFSVFIVLTVVLSFLGFNSSHSESETSEATGFSIEEYINQQKKSLNKQDATVVAALEADLKSSRGTAKTDILLKLSEKWQQADKLPVAAYYNHQLAHLNPSKQTWETAANSLFNSLSQIQDSITSVYYYSQAEEAYNHLLELDPDNTQAKINLAVCLVDYKQQVMQGVQMLKQVVEEDENNEQAIYILGLLSIRSTQYDKALERFEKLVSLQPENPEYRILLGNVLSTLGEKDKAIQSYEAAIPLLNDEEAVEKVNNIIKDIKKN